MANPYSLIHNYNQVPLYNHQFDLLATGLAAKEQGLAQGRDKVQQTFDQMANLDLYKDVDKEYAQDRLAEILAYTDKYSSMDLSNPDLANNIAKNYTQVLDENVVNAIASTKLFKAEQAEWEDKKKNKPELYNEDNRRYALRATEQWLNSDQVGATYRGGAGFIEYSDYKGKLTETMMKAAKEKGYEYIETTPGNGVFREQVTKRVIDRNEMQSVLQGAIDPKMRKQMEIDAWAQYGGMPDEAIQAIYTEEHDKDVSKFQSEKAKYEALRNTSTNPNEKAAYDNYIKQLDEGLTNLSQNPYEKVGKERAYTAMYMKELEDNYLDAYSRAPYEVKREVNALDEATANYKMKEGEFNLSQDKFEETKSQNRIALKERELSIKAEGKVGKSESDLVNTIMNPFDEALSVVKTSPQEKEGEYAQSEVQWVQNAEKNAYNKFKSYYKDKISPEDMNSPELVTVLKNGGAGKDKHVVTLKSGKKVTINMLDPYVNTLVHNYRSMVLDDAPVQKKVYEAVNNQAEKVKNALVKNATTLGVIPEYKIVGTEDNFKIVPVNFEKAGRDNFDNFSSLLYKKQAGKKLTWAEEKSLDLYVKTSMYYGKETSADAKAMIKKSIEKEILWKAQNKKSFDYVSSKVRQAGIPSEKNPGLDVENHWTRGIVTSDIDLGDFSKSVEAEFKSARGITNYNQTKLVTVIDQKQDPKTWQKVEELFPGKLEKDYEVNIIPDTWANGLPKGTSKLVITDKDGEVVDKGNINLSPEQLKTLTGKELQIRRDAFDARFGEFAQSANLGNGSFTSLQNDNGEIEMSNMERYNRLQLGQENMYISSSGVAVPYFSQDFYNQGFQDFSELGYGNLFAKEKSDLEQGLYDFKFEPIDGQYAISVYKNKKRVYAKPTGMVSLNKNELVEIDARSQVLSRQAWFDYVKAKALTQSADYQTGN